ncbi:MAG: RNA polymerase-binding protein DksA [Thiohalocapsa sp. PB-PSB1]|jgi:DnaK suppressor protein|nr:MAG: molecular chaperone DnaK [Thiohalocapsa sp. PB-PSB1]QQO53494.1 MAG: RNA polymerase-binding protein DksA [Thiohalocapsa sp. PB-PSB1]HCS90188.1 RNA polymerase-binding protein DksA [Chromatiaceae bacterium]
MQESQQAQHAQILGSADGGPPIDDDYMGPRQLAYFRRKLLDWRSTLLAEADATLAELRDDSHHEVGDEADRANREAAQALDLRTRDRHRKLLGKIDAAIDRIDDGSYGWCEETGEPIGLARLEARPVATLCVEAQERRELRERQTSAG